MEQASVYQIAGESEFGIVVHIGRRKYEDGVSWIDDLRYTGCCRHKIFE